MGTGMGGCRMRHLKIYETYNGLFTWIVRYYIIPGSKSMRQVEISAHDYNDCLKEFERKTGISKKSVISARKYGDVK